MQTVTLRGEDFKILHNTLCDLRNLVERMDQSMIKTSEFDRIIEGFEMALKDAYQQENAQFDSKMDYYHRFQKDNDLKTIWSIFELPIHGFLADHPFKDAREICYRDHWGEDAVYETIQGSTWADLYRAADRCIQRSGDQHHCFIEGFYPVANQPHQLRLTTGS
jgi:hypothetical protein